MTRRHYGVRQTKPATNRGEAPRWSGNAFIFGASGESS